MENKITKCARVILLLISLLVFSCATVPKKEQATIYPQNDEFRKNLGTIGIVSARFEPRVEFLKPMTKGTAAGVGAGSGALVALGGGCYAGALSANPFGVVAGAALGVGLMPVGAAIGGIVGAVKGESSKKIKATEDALNNYIATLKLQEMMQERFLLAARDRTQYPFIVVKGQGPKTLDDEVRYDSSLSKAIDTILEISTRKHGLWPTTGVFNPSFSFFMTASIRVIRITDNEVLYTRTFRYESGHRKFADWGVNDAQPYIEEVDRSCSNLAMEIVEELFPITQITLDQEVLQ